MRDQSSLRCSTFVGTALDIDTPVIANSKFTFAFKHLRFSRKARLFASCFAYCRICDSKKKSLMICLVKNFIAL
jgi:hypothetical protein